MNKHELKSLLENIYTALTEQNPPPLPPRLSLPDGPTGPPPTPPDVYRNDPARDPNWTPPDVGGGWTWRYVKGYWRLYPPVATPLPPKPTPNPPGAEEMPNGWDGPALDLTKPTGEQRLRDLLRELGIEDEVYPSLFN